MEMKNKKETILNKCPLCGGELEFVDLYQISHVYKILKNGKISKNMKYKRDEGPENASFICCSMCTFHTDCDYEVKETGAYTHISIKENDNDQFVVDFD